jgi:hypothetical protein
VEERITQTQKRGSVVVQRDSEGQVQSFDAEGNKVVPSGIDEQLRRVMDEISKIDSTPPKDIIAVSPGSASQGLRRKAILEGLGDGPAKRARLEYDGPASSTTPSTASNAKPASQREHEFLAVLKHSEESAGAPYAEADTERFCVASRATLITHPFSAILTRDGEEIQIDHEDPSLQNRPGDEDTSFDVFHDIEDNVRRCIHCGHELWRDMGFCTGGCEDGLDGISYFELIDPEDNSHSRPDVEVNEWSRHLEGLNDLTDRRKLVGNYLDDHSDAYDTVDEDPDHQSEYDSEDSFIDDASIHGSENEDEDDTSSGDGQTDYKQLCNELQRRYDDLIRDHNNLANRFDEVMRELLGSDYEGPYEPFIEDEDTDEDGALMVDAAVPNPAVVDLVLSQADEQSQESDVSPDRIMARVKAFEAAAREDWNNISMVSTGANHTHEEIEL